jgi:hypothetical protein
MVYVSYGSIMQPEVIESQESVGSRLYSYTCTFLLGLCVGWIAFVIPSG